MTVCDQPLWSRSFTAAAAKSREADTERCVALSLRCEAEESGGVRCTADADPPHAHRYRREDLPTCTFPT